MENMNKQEKDIAAHLLLSRFEAYLRTEQYLEAGTVKDMAMNMGFRELSANMLLTLERAYSKTKIKLES
ncbi:hypothetical protein BH09BAC1_BH09BAC1_08800 [soil metagenome]